MKIYEKCNTDDCIFVNIQYELRKPKKRRHSASSILTLILFMSVMMLTIFTTVTDTSYASTLKIIEAEETETEIIPDESKHTDIVKTVSYMNDDERVQLNTVKETEIETEVEEPETETETEIEEIETDETEAVVEETTTEELEYRYNISDWEFDEMVRCVEAEVTGYDPPGSSDYDEVFAAKLHVAQVILNRVESKYFPNTVHEVVFQPYAFSPVYDGRYYDVEISQITIDACRTALLADTEDTTDGCEFFIWNSTYCDYGTYKFTDAVNHSFFKYNRTD